MSNLVPAAQGHVAWQANEPRSHRVPAALTPPEASSALGPAVRVCEARPLRAEAVGLMEARLLGFQRYLFGGSSLRRTPSKVAFQPFPPGRRAWATPDSKFPPD